LSKINIFFEEKKITKHEKTPINKMVEECWGKRMQYIYIYRERERERV